MSRALSPKQQRFVEEYLVDLNATQAFIRAGYTARGNAAEVNAARLLRNAKVAEAIQVKRQEQSERTQITADWVLKRLQEEATPGEDTGFAPARVKALELLGKHLGLFPDKLKIEGNVTHEIHLNEDSLPD